MSHPGSDGTLIDRLLAEQRELTAVERFSRSHSHHSLPTQARYYRDLLPLTPPRAGQQYAFEVDLDQCSGCKACVTACHALNGLEEGESWRSVGLLIGELPPIPSLPPTPVPVQRTVTTACHHCVDPECLNGCPVLAYEKDPITGIVQHLDDQCIGCQYCIMKCPYEVPQFSRRLGIVRKCDMCSQRLSVGEAPACVQACPNEAIRISLVELEAATRRFRNSTTQPATQAVAPANDTSDRDPSNPLPPPPRVAPLDNPFLPASPAPHISLPTTLYRSSLLGQADLHAADEGFLRPAHPHLPLAFMLPLSQFSAGLMAALAFTPPLSPSPPLTTLAFVIMALALGVATLHLGQPLRAWKAFLGWRRSWFSREVIAFAAYVHLLAILSFKPDLLPSATQPAASAIAAVVGLAAVYCSVMIYADTQREFWSFPRTAFRFFGSTLLLGTAATAAFLNPHPLAWIAVLGLATLKLSGEGEILRWKYAQGFPPLKKSALLTLGPLRLVFRLRLALGILGGLLLPILMILGTLPTTSVWAITSLLLIFAGECAERVLFFTTVSPTRMPGGVTT